jgi:hypothetical protein
MPFVLPASNPALTVLPYALWTAQEPRPSALTQVFNNAALPNLCAWAGQSQRRVVAQESPTGWAPAALSLPHECLQAQALGWPVVDGCLPWAAQRAAELGLKAALSEPGAPAAWGFISVCNWLVSNGQVTLGHPAQLAVDDATDLALFNAMAPFFAEDGFTLHRDVPGRWLVHSPVLADVPTASLERVIGRNIDPWLVGGDAPNGTAKLLRRLQNEMQMLLYTHAVNAHRALSINSFWLHGTGALPVSLAHAPVPVNVVNHLRDSALQQDLMAWLDVWKVVDSEVMAPVLAAAAQGQAQQVVLCGEHEHHVYDSAKPGLWQRLRGHFKPLTLDTVLAVTAPKE